MAEKEPCWSLSPCHHCHQGSCSVGGLGFSLALPSRYSCRVESGWLIQCDQACSLVALCKLLIIGKPCWFTCRSFLPFLLSYGSQQPWTGRWLNHILPSLLIFVGTFACLFFLFFSKCWGSNSKLYSLKRCSLWSYSPRC